MPNSKAKPDGIEPVDVAVGQRLRSFRKLAAMSQSTLAGHLGITFQQIQKYENGTNRISASRLQLAANVLGTPVSSFFEETRQEDGATGVGYPPVADLVLFLQSSEGGQLNKAFATITDAQIRRRLVALVQAIGNGTD